jgi:hypothetical protein
LAGSLAFSNPALAPLAAQEWPTLADAGLAYMSTGGGVQLDISGQLDLEVLAFTGHDAGLAYGKGTFVAPRTRLFADVFLGERIYGLRELRSDRGEAPTVGVWEARVEQAFVRVSNLGGTLGIQAGRFASPFGSYAGRHLTTVDPFIRPPLAYDYRTIMSRTIAPPDADRFLRWKHDPEKFRGTVGAPPVWGVPYQWGAMLSGLVGEIQYRVGAMNSAPSSEVDAWGWNADRFKDPSFVLGAQAPLSADLSLGVSYNRGPYAEPEISSGYHTVYTQEMVSLDVKLARGPLVARAEVIRDQWVVPNLSEEPVEWAYGAEVQVDVAAGFSLAVRYGYVDFRSFGDGLGSASPRPDARSDWDHDIARYEVAVGYRLARNAGLLGTFMHNENEELVGGDPDDDLFAVRLLWAF